MKDIVKLTGLLKEVADVHGVSIGRKNDKTTWRVDYKDSATVEQLAAVKIVLDAFDFDTPEELAAKAAYEAELPSLEEKVDAILDGGAKLDEVKAKILSVKIKHGRG